MADIRFTQSRKQIISLWSNVFKDSEEDIVFFLDNCKKYKCLGLFEDEKLASMLFLVECSYCNKDGYYVYAVATDEDYRKKGYSTSLLNYAKGLNKDFLWLIPAKDGLISFYQKRGFSVRLYSDCDYENSVCFNQSEEIKEYLYEGCSLEHPVGMIFSKYDFPKGKIK